MQTNRNILQFAMQMYATSSKENGWKMDARSSKEQPAAEPTKFT